MKSESNIQLEVRLEASREGFTLFRQNVGKGWVGSRVTQLGGGDVIVHDARPIDFGLIKGSADLIGWYPVTVTEEMVGRRIAVFASCEVKTETGRLRPEQKTWMQNVLSAGGIAFVARAKEELKEVMGKWMSKN